MVAPIDGGNFDVKFINRFGVQKYCSDIGEYRERKGERSMFSQYDMEFEYNGRKGFAGPLAKYESEFVGTMKGDTKAHDDAKLRILLSLHQHFDYDVLNIVVGQPIIKHTAEEREKIVHMLQGTHTLTVNNVKRTFLIENVSVATEGASALLAKPEKGLIRIIDIGSGTINMATMNDFNFIDRDSTTLTLGLETLKTRNYDELARSIENKAHDNRWSRSDQVRLVGGGAESMLPYIQKRFPNTKVLYPEYLGKRYDPEYANVIGYQKIGEVLYG